MTAERCDALATRATQLQAHTAEVLCRMGELTTHVATGQIRVTPARGMRRPRDLISRCLLWTTPLRLRNTSLSQDYQLCIHHIRWQQHWGLAPVRRSWAFLRRRRSRPPMHASRQRTALRHAATTTTLTSTTVTERSTVKHSFAVAGVHSTRQPGRTDPSSCAMQRRFSAPTRALSTGWVPAEMRTRTRVDCGLSFAASAASKIVRSTVAIRTLEFLHHARAERDYLLSTMY